MFHQYLVEESQAGWGGAGEPKHPHPAGARRRRHWRIKSLEPSSSMLSPRQQVHTSHVIISEKEEKGKGRALIFL